MNKVRSERFRLLEARPKITGARTGRIVAIERSGKVLVDFEDNPFGPVAARRTASVSLGDLRRAADWQDTVLLTFDGNDPNSPIILDVLESGQPRRRVATLTDRKKHTRQRRRPVAGSARHLSQSVTGITVGRIVSVQDGVVCVDFDGNPIGPRAARTTVPLRNLKDEILLVLPGGEPIIVGQLYAAVPLEGSGSADTDAVFKGRCIRIEAATELLLIAGRSKIHLDARGKVSTTADHVLSRARGANKVQGGSVQLN